VLAAIALDRASKLAVAAFLQPGEPVELLGPFLRLISAENTGGVLGVLQGSSGLFALASALVIVGLVVLHERGDRSVLERLGYGVLIGGACGNLIDRVARGSVLDFVDLGLGTLRVPLFNLADVAVTGGILLILLAGRRGRRRPPFQESPPA
jgi:signal peptidase II